MSQWLWWKLQSGIEKLTLKERLKNIAVKGSLDYISDIVGPDLQDGCNLSEDENDEQEKDNKDLKPTVTGKILIKILKVWLHFHFIILNCVYNFLFFNLYSSIKPSSFLGIILRRKWISRCSEC